MPNFLEKKVLREKKRTKPEVSYCRLQTILQSLLVKIAWHWHAHIHTKPDT